MAEYYRPLEMRPPAEFEVNRYAVRPMGVTLVVSLYFGLCSAIPIAPLWLVNQPLVPISLPSLFIVSILLWAPVVLVGVLLFDRAVPLRIGPAGISTYNGFGIRIRVPWSEVTGVKNIPIGPGLRYLYLQHGRNIFTGAYAALFLKDYEKFRSEVIGYVGADHPFARAL